MTCKDCEKGVQVPEWLSAMAHRQTTDDDLAEVYPAVAHAACKMVESGKINFVIAALMQLVIDEVDRLQAIVAKLLKTADGVYWVPEQDIDFYYPHEAGSQDDVSIKDGRWVAWWWVMEGGASVGRCHDIGECYSTPETAEAAGKDVTPCHLRVERDVVRACNVYDDLLKALADLVEIDRTDGLMNLDKTATDEWRDQAWENARAAIAKAEGEEVGS